MNDWIEEFESEAQSCKVVSPKGGISGSSRVKSVFKFVAEILIDFLKDNALLAARMTNSACMRSKG